tara:strand:- start:187 stop:576 length:390 start_codon:yes stop_codon:yes gene_type:complete
MNKNNYDLSAALRSLRPGAECVIYGTEYSGIEWFDENQEKPTEEEVVQKIAELKYQEEVNEYQRQRAFEYPPIEEQQDMQFHDAVNGTTTWKDAIQAVKDKYPKKKMNTRTLNKRKKDALAKLEASRES